MNKTILTLIGTLSIGSPVFANDEVYFGINGGGAVDTQQLIDEHKLVTDNGYFNLTAKGGYLFDLGSVKVGPEVEYTHHFSDDVFANGLSGNDYFGRVMVNGVVKTDFGWFVDPYVFGGVGAEFDDRLVGTDTEEGVYQLGVGFNVPVTANLGLDAGYRYVDYFSNDFGVNPNHELFAGIRLTF